MSVAIREMTTDDHDATVALWHSVPGVEVTGADTREGVGVFLARNPGLSFVAVDGERVVGTVLCGHDGRRGYISHLAVADSHRRTGIGGRMVRRCIDRLDENGIQKCHVFVFRENELALSFWNGTGWTPRIELELLSMFTTPERRER